MSARSELVVLPPNEATWDDLQAVLGTRGQAARCQCQRYKLGPGESFASFPVGERAERLHEQTTCDQTTSDATSGLIAHLEGEPAGWCAVEPRSAYRGLLRNSRVPWVGRDEDKSDDGVWAVTCFVTRVGFRRQGVARALARGAVDLARQRGAGAVEAYPITTNEVVLEELHVGTPAMFRDAGMTEVSRPTTRRLVMRIDL